MYPKNIIGVPMRHIPEWFCSVCKPRREVSKRAVFSSEHSSVAQLCKSMEEDIKVMC